MTSKTSRFLLIPLGLLTILILAACAPAETAPLTSSPPAASPSQPDVAPPAPTIANTTPNAMPNDSAERQDAMMEGDELQTLANHMNATFAPMQNLASMMSDNEQSTALMADLEEMQQEMDALLKSPNSEQLGVMMQETSGLMTTFADMMASESWDNHSEEALAQMEQLMLHMGFMAESMEGLAGNQRFLEQMNGYQQQFQDMMNEQSASAQDLDAMMGNFGTMMADMGAMVNTAGDMPDTPNMTGETSDNGMMDSGGTSEDAMDANDSNDTMMADETMEEEMMGENPASDTPNDQPDTPSQQQGSDMPDNEMPGNNGDMGGGMGGGMGSG